jgi:hypothetical protein
MKVPGISLEDVAICCDLERHVFNHQHTDGGVAAALRETHWYDLREWVKTRPGAAGA